MYGNSYFRYALAAATSCAGLVIYSLDSLAPYPLLFLLIKGRAQGIEFTASLLEVIAVIIYLVLL